MTTATVSLGRLPYMDDAGSAGHRVVRPSPDPPSAAEATYDLVQKVRAGDSVAADILFSRYESRLRRWAHGRLPAQARGAHDTQDLVQETLVRVFNRLPKFEPRHPGAFRDYVWTTMWNAVRDLARKYKRRGPADSLDAHELAAIDPSPLEEAIGAEALDRYDTAMERLRPEDREAIIMRIELGLSHAEIMEALGKPSVAAAHMAVSRALVRLAQEMAHAHVHPR
jgi:RNA polymerase sigma-70 factor (ECF subfamily)